MYTEVIPFSKYSYAWILCYRNLLRRQFVDAEGSTYSQMQL